MDIDRYIARNQAAWDRLDQLSRQARGGVHRLAPEELEEMVQLYQRASAQLSYIRTYVREPSLLARLTRTVATANGVIYGKRARTTRALRNFFVVTFPAAVYHSRRAIAVAAALFFVPAILLGVWLSHDADALAASGSPAYREHILRDEFEQYYSENPHPVFFTKVTTNNIRVSFLVFASGIVLPIVGPAYLLVRNGLPLGEYGAWFVAADDFPRFLALVSPHGMLELSAIIIAGGAGLALGWSLVAPGDRPRSAALREEGRRLVVIVIGLMVMFLAAGLIEGFVTGAGLPRAIPVVIGVAGWIAFVLYFVVQGRAAAAKGLTGAWGELERYERDQAIAAERAARRATVARPARPPSVLPRSSDTFTA